MTSSEWKFSQVFGERSYNDHVEEADIISAMEFKSNGEYFATGDQGGRVVLFRKEDGGNLNSRREMEKMDQAAAVHPRYAYMTEFQSHEPEFDYLKSLEINEKINKLRWCGSPNNSLFIMSTNDRTIKLWKVLEHKVKKVKEMSQTPYVNSENSLLASFLDENVSSCTNEYQREWPSDIYEITSSTYRERSMATYYKGNCVSSRCRRVYSHAHDYNINSISHNSDGETFISADDLRINLWNTEIGNQCFNIIDKKPIDMEQLLEVITSAEFHPASCNVLAYSSSRGFIRLVDMRQSALCDHHSKTLQDCDVHGSRSFFTEIAASISDMKFTRDGRHILSRDYMNLKLWDLRMETFPIATFKIQDYLRPKLSELYNCDSIFDKFTCCLSSDGHHFASGSYSNTFKVFSYADGPNGGITLEASRNPNRIRAFSGNSCFSSRTPDHQNFPKIARLLTSFTRGQTRRGHDSSSFDGEVTPGCLKSKLTNLAWHPTANLIACAASDSLYMYHS